MTPAAEPTKVANDAPTDQLADSPAALNQRILDLAEAVHNYSSVSDKPLPVSVEAALEALLRWSTGQLRPRRRATSMYGPSDQDQEIDGLEVPVQPAPAPEPDQLFAGFQVSETPYEPAPRVETRLRTQQPLEL